MKVKKMDDNFICRICRRTFKSQSELTRHANAVHYGKTAFSQISESQLQPIQSPEYDSGLWSMPITLESTSPTFAENSASQVDITEVIIDEQSKIEQQYSLRSHAESEMKEIVEENIEEMEMDLQINFENHDFNSEDLQSASLEDALDAIKGETISERIVN